MLLRFANETEWLEAKKQDVTSTEVAALFGLNPYKSRLRLWHEKAGNVEADYEDNPFMKWGRRLQNAVAQGICEDQGWNGLMDLRLYYARDPSLKLGASFDFSVITDEKRHAMLEIKVAEKFSKEMGWFDDKAPIPYEFQIQAQLHLAMREDAKIEIGVIGTLGARQHTRLYFREYDAALGSLIDEEVHKFWKSIEINSPPDPDYVVDADLIEKMRGPIRNGDIIRLDNDRAKELLNIYKLCDTDYKSKKKLCDAAKKQRDKAKSELLHLIGRNEVAIIGDYQISAKEQIREDRVTYGSSFRRFDIKKRRK